MLTLFETYKIWAKVFSKGIKYRNGKDVYKEAISEYPELKELMFHIKGSNNHLLHPDEIPIYKRILACQNFNSQKVQLNEESYEDEFAQNIEGFEFDEDKAIDRAFENRLFHLKYFDFDKIPPDTDWYFEGLAPYPYFDEKLQYIKLQYIEEYGCKTPQAFTIPASEQELKEQSVGLGVDIPAWLNLIGLDGYARIFNIKSGFVGAKDFMYLKLVCGAAAHKTHAEGVTKQDYAQACKKGLVNLYNYHGEQQNSLPIVPLTADSLSAYALTAKDDETGRKYALIKNGNELVSGYDFLSFERYYGEFYIENLEKKWGIWDRKKGWLLKPTRKLLSLSQRFQTWRERLVIINWGLFATIPVLLVASNFFNIPSVLFPLLLGAITISMLLHALIRIKQKDIDWAFWASLFLAALSAALASNAIFSAFG